MSRAAVVAIGMALILACEPEPDGPVARWASTVAWLRSSADGYLQSGAVTDAELELRRALAMPMPTGAKGEGLLQDVDFALGSVLLLQGRAEEALVVAKRGLDRSSAPSVFVANLHALRGIALEARGHAVESAEAYHAALLIHEQLYNDALARAQTQESPE